MPTFIPAFNLATAPNQPTSQAITFTRNSIVRAIQLATGNDRPQTLAYTYTRYPITGPVPYYRPDEQTIGNSL